MQLFQASKGTSVDSTNWISICNFLSGAKTTKLKRLILYEPFPCGNSQTNQLYKVMTASLDSLPGLKGFKYDREQEETKNENSGYSHNSLKSDYWVFLIRCLADPGEARGCSTNSLVIK